MYNHLGVQRYKETNIQSMTQEKMIILLYERVIGDLESAGAALAKGDNVEMIRLVSHSQRIVGELRNALDHSIGGEISRNLESLYDYLFHEHLEVIVDRNPEHLDNCIRVVTPLLDSWRRIPAGTGQQAQRDHARGNLGNAQSGPEPATQKAETPNSEPAVTDAAVGTNAEPQGKISLSV